MIFIEHFIACSTCFGHHYAHYQDAHHQEFEIIIQMVAACRIWCFGFQVVGMVWSWGLCVRFAGFSLRAPLCPSSGARDYYTDGCCLSYLVLWFSSCRYDVELNLKSKAPNITGSNLLYNTLELLMMGIMVPETYWANNKICNKNHLLHLVGILFLHTNVHSRNFGDM